MTEMYKTIWGQAAAYGSWQPIALFYRNKE